jgi:hypothetical protein
MKQTLLMTLWMLLTLTSCNVGLEESPKLITDIDDEFSIDLLEVLTPQMRSLEFRTTAINNRRCVSYKINQELSVGFFSISLNFSKVVVSGQQNCDMQEPVIAVARLNALENGVYDLQFNINKNIVSRGKLLVSDEDYELVFTAVNGIILLNRKLNRIPAQTVWGFIAYQENSLDDVQEKLVNEFKDLTQLTQLPVGNYGYFNIDADRQIRPKTFPVSGKYLAVIGHYDNLEALRLLVGKYRTAHPGLTLNFYTANGDVF